MTSSSNSLTSLADHKLVPLSDAQLLALTFDLNPVRINNLKGMSYLTQQDVRATLSGIFGFGGFSYLMTNQRLLREEQVPQSKDPNKMNWSITWMTTLRLEIPQLGAFFEESAQGNNKQPDWMEASDMAMKTSASDALKRCAINLGTQFGLSLYNKGQTSSIVPKSLAPGGQWPRPVEDRATEALKLMIEQTPVTEEALAAAKEMYPEPAQGVTQQQHNANVHLTARAIQHRWNLEREGSVAVEAAAGATAQAEAEAAAAESES